MSRNTIFHNFLTHFQQAASPDSDIFQDDQDDHRPLDTILATKEHSSQQPTTARSLSDGATKAIQWTLNSFLRQSANNGGMALATSAGYLGLYELLKKDPQALSRGWWKRLPYNGVAIGGALAMAEKVADGKRPQDMTNAERLKCIVAGSITEVMLGSIIDIAAISNALTATKSRHFLVHNYAELAKLSDSDFWRVTKFVTESQAVDLHERYSDKLKDHGIVIKDGATPKEITSVLNSKEGAVALTKIQRCKNITFTDPDVLKTLCDNFGQSVKPTYGDFGKATLASLPFSFFRNSPLFFSIYYGIKNGETSFPTLATIGAVGGAASSPFNTAGSRAMIESMKGKEVLPSMIDAIKFTKTQIVTDPKSAAISALVRSVAGVAASAIFNPTTTKNISELFHNAIMTIAKQELSDNETEALEKELRKTIESNPKLAEGVVTAIQNTIENPGTNLTEDLKKSLETMAESLQTEEPSSKIKPSEQTKTKLGDTKTK
jgi:hypothetical protein